MKILILSDAASAHTIKWVNGLNNRGIDIYLFSLTKPDYSSMNISPEKIFFHHTKEKLFLNSNPSLSKLIYLKSLPALIKLIKKINPDIIHAHYATSYGLLGVLSSFHPFVLSVWGSDVFDFPKSNKINKALLKYIFKKADHICSTSNIMANEIKLYTNKKINVIPFGINIPLLAGIKNNKNIITIGIVKTLEELYGINYLIEAFNILINKGYLNLRLLIVGKGTQHENLLNIVKKYGIEDKVEFSGYIDSTKIWEYHNRIDIAVYPSIKESFGVAVLESMACKKPVIVSDAHGFKEIVKHNQTGIIVEKKNSVLIANAIETLLNNNEEKEKLALNGYKFVKEQYNFDDNLDTQIELYKKILNPS